MDIAAAGAHFHTAVLTVRIGIEEIGNGSCISMNYSRTYGDPRRLRSIAY